MKLAKDLLALSVPLLFGLMVLAAGIQAGTEDYYSDAVDFSLSNETAFVPGTTDDPDDEQATVVLSANFDTPPGGYIDYLIIKFSYDPDSLDLVEAVPSAGWGDFTTSDYNISYSGGNPETVTFSVSYAASSLEAAAGDVALANFVFEPTCQSENNATPVNLLYGQGVAELHIDQDVYYADDATEVTHGSVTTADYVSEIYMVSTDASVTEYDGALGDIIEVPIYLSTNFRPGLIFVEFSYDTDKLVYVGWEDRNPFFGTLQGFYQTGDELLGAFYPVWASVTELNEPILMVNVQFRTIGAWDGETATFDFTGTEGDNFMWVLAGENQCLQLSAHDPGFNSGTIRIPTYEANLTTLFSDGGTLSLYDDEVDLVVQMDNNFPAGADFRSIIVNMNLSDALKPEWLMESDVGDLSWELNSWTNQTSFETEISVHRSSATAGFMDISEDAVDLFGVPLETTPAFAPPTDFDDHLIPLVYTHDYDSEPTYYARVTDTTQGVETTIPGFTLTHDAPTVNYLMGEFACNSPTAGTHYEVTQTIYARNSFPVDDFRLKVLVDGQHTIKTVSPVSGITKINQGSKSVVLVPDAGSWTGLAATDDRTPIASITYSLYYSSQQLENPMDETVYKSSLPGPIGSYVTKYSDIDFELTGLEYSFMADDADNEHHLLALSGRVGSSYRIYANEENENLAERYGSGIPEYFELRQNYPNPFNPATDIIFGLPQPSRVRIDVYNITGQRVATLLDHLMPAGYFSTTFNGEGLASGVYFYRLVTDQTSLSKKMMLVK